MTDADHPPPDASHDTTSIGERITLLRTLRGITQRQLADAIGMSQQGVAEIEGRGESRPRKLHEIAAALHTTPKWLLNGDDAVTAEQVLKQRHHQTRRLNSGQSPEIAALRFLLRQAWDRIAELERR